MYASLYDTNNQKIKWTEVAEQKISSYATAQFKALESIRGHAHKTFTFTLKYKEKIR